MFIRGSFFFLAKPLAGRSYVFYVFLYVKTSLLNPSTMMRWPKHLGGGSVCSILIKNLHPKNIVAVAFPNATAQDRLDDLVAFKKDSVHRQGGRVTKNAIYFLTLSIPNEEV